MRDEVVAIDLETTGLDVNEDAIIEIGAVRMKEGEILEEFDTLIYPDMPIPDRTTLLTGIRQEDVIGAPRIKEILPDLFAFVGDAPIVGHSVGFDISFLNKHGLFMHNTPLDTYDLASVLLPKAARYNLNSLTEMFNITLQDAHRALDDARAAGILYWQLYLKALELPLDVLDSINKAARGLQWSAAHTFTAAYEEKKRNAAQSAKSSNGKKQQSPLTNLKPLKPNDEIIDVEISAINEIFAKNGTLAKALPNFEHRPQQQQMASLIAHTFNESEHALIEAGTGTGKSLAYLVPAFEWASTNNERVVISTDTIALQDQLIHKDIPLLQQALGINLNAAVLKGRSNYLCPIRLEALKRRGPTSIEELRILAKIMVWQIEDDSGDKTNISLRGAAEHSIWSRISSAEGDGCRHNQCQDELGIDCPFYRAYKQAEAAHLVIVNHALLIADAKAESRILPPYNYIIIDEGHHLEESVTNSLSFELDELTLLRRIEDLGNERRGLLADLVSSLRTSDVPAKKTERIQAYTQNVNEAANQMGMHIQNLFKALRHFVEASGKLAKNDFIAHVRLSTQDISSRYFAPAAQAWEILQEFMFVISEATEELSNVLVSLENYHIDNYSDLLRNMQSIARYLTQTSSTLNGFFSQQDANVIYWLTVSQDGKRLSINTAPLHVGPMISETLWNQRNSVILTSATLRTNGSFEHIQDRVYAENVSTYEIGSPFDYKSSTMLFLPTDIPDPREYNTYQQMVEQSIIALASALNGRVLALFTSYSQLRQTSKTITPRLAMGNITVYDQSDGTSRQSLLEGFKSTEKAVLLGTRSFWEGVDIPGDSLSALVITRLPFPVPNDPIFAARSELYNNSFNDFAVPEAILRFRQGFGRLIRTHTDRGIVVVLDSRIINKPYGAAFIDALPECKVVHAPTSALAQNALKWIQQ